MGAAGRRSPRVAALCETTLRRLPAGSVRDEIQAILDRLGEPLRIAVAGRAKAGKSTLVNALLGKKVAPTDVGECTRVVTIFREGFPEAIDLIPREGDPRGLRFEGDGLPRELGCDPESVRCLVVSLSHEALEEATIIDTPGLSSATERASDPTEELLGMHHASARAIADASALVFLISQTAREDDREALDAFAEMLAGSQATIARTVGVLSHADKIARGDWARAVDVASRYGKAFQSRLVTVVPMVGNIAEAVLCGDFNEGDALDLVRLAQVDPAGRRAMLLSVDLLRKRAPLPAERVERLLRILGLFGIERALQSIDGGTTEAAALAADLLEASGIEALRTIVRERFVRHADTLKARDALTALDHVSYHRADDRVEQELIQLRADVEALSLDPEMHRIKELWALEQAAADGTEVGPDLVEELALLATDGTPAERLGLPSDVDARELERVLHARVDRWNELSGVGTAESLIADVVGRSYGLLEAELRQKAAPSAA